MRLEKCYFCSSTCYPGHGIQFVRLDGKAFRFCRSKCHKLFKQRRNPRKLRWTKAFRKAAGKEMVVEGALVEFEKRRNVPVRYDRDVVRGVVKAMKRVGEVRKKRERVHYEERMKESREARRERARAVAGEHVIETQRQQSLVERLKEKQALLKTKITNKLTTKQTSKSIKAVEKMTVMEIDG